MLLTKCVNRSRCKEVYVSKFRDGWFLIWDERHLEMTTSDEFMAVELGDDWIEQYRPEQERTARAEGKRLSELLPSQQRQLPLTPAQAFVLVAACYCRSEGAGLSEQSPFAPEIEALLP
jgi:hypothetical protein